MISPADEKMILDTMRKQEQNLGREPEFFELLDALKRIDEK